MGINQLRLSPALIALLYPDSLVGINLSDMGKKPADPAKTGLTASGLSFLGKNLRSICFVVSYPEVEFMPEESLHFLRKMLSACKLSLNDIALINIFRHPISLEALKIQFSPEIIFLWGCMPESFNALKDLQDMHIRIHDHISVIPVFEADKMSGDEQEAIDLKRSLWISLKKIFTL